jgi:hypothetical protein
LRGAGESWPEVEVPGILGDEGEEGIVDVELGEELIGNTAALADVGLLCSSGGAELVCLSLGSD